MLHYRLHHHTHRQQHTSHVVRLKLWHQGTFPSPLLAHQHLSTSLDATTTIVTSSTLVRSVCQAAPLSHVAPAPLLEVVGHTTHHTDAHLPEPHQPPAPHRQCWLNATLHAMCGYCTMVCLETPQQSSLIKQGVPAFPAAGHCDEKVSCTAARGAKAAGWQRTAQAAPYTGRTPNMEHGTTDATRCQCSTCQDFKSLNAQTGRGAAACMSCRVTMQHQHQQQLCKHHRQRGRPLPGWCTCMHPVNMTGLVVTEAVRL